MTKDYRHVLFRIRNVFRSRLLQRLPACALLYERGYALRWASVRELPAARA